MHWCPFHWPSILIEQCRCWLWKELPLEIPFFRIFHKTHLNSFSDLIFFRFGRRIEKVIISLLSIIIQARACWQRRWQRWRWQNSAKTDGYYPTMIKWTVPSSFCSLRCRPLPKSWMYKFASGESISSRSVIIFCICISKWGFPIQKSAIMFVFEMGKPTHSEPQPFSKCILCINVFQVMLSDPKLLKKPEEKSAMGPILRVGMDYHYWTNTMVDTELWSRFNCYIPELKPILQLFQNGYIF